MAYNPDCPPFKVNDEVIVKHDVYTESIYSGRETLVFRKGEILKVRGCWFFSRTKGWEVAFFESEKNNRHYFFMNSNFELKSKYDERKQRINRILQKVKNFFKTTDKTIQ